MASECAIFHKWVEVMNEMLTAKEMQELLQVDRSTIYRMAESGRLPAIKVGKQWRFPAAQVEGWFQLQIPASPASRLSEVEPKRDEPGEELAALLPLECVQLVQDTFADLLGVMLVVTDIEGYPITEPSNPCGLFMAISQVPDALEKCIRSWHSLATAIDLEPRFSKSNLGLLCSRAMIRVGTELKGMVIAGCVAPDHWPPNESAVNQMAEEFCVEPELLASHLDEVFVLDQAQQARILAHLQRIASIVAHIVDERKTLVGRLEAIADLTTI